MDLPPSLDKLRLKALSLATVRLQNTKVSMAAIAVAVVFASFGVSLMLMNWLSSTAPNPAPKIAELPPLLDAAEEPGEFSPGRNTEPTLVRQGYGDVEPVFARAETVVELDLAVGRHSGNQPAFLQNLFGQVVQQIVHRRVAECLGRNASCLRVDLARDLAIGLDQERCERLIGHRR